MICFLGNSIYVLSPACLHLFVCCHVHPNWTLPKTQQVNSRFRHMPNAKPAALKTSSTKITLRGVKPSSPACSLDPWLLSLIILVLNLNNILSVYQYQMKSLQSCQHISFSTHPLLVSKNLTNTCFNIYFLSFNFNIHFMKTALLPLYNFYNHFCLFQLLDDVCTLP